MGGTDIKVLHHDSLEAIKGDYSNRILGDAIISVGASAADTDVQKYLNLGDDKLRDPLLSKPKGILDGPRLQTH